MKKTLLTTIFILFCTLSSTAFASQDFVSGPLDIDEAHFYLTLLGSDDKKTSFDFSKDLYGNITEIPYLYFNYTADEVLEYTFVYDPLTDDPSYEKYDGEIVTTLTVNADWTFGSTTFKMPITSQTTILENGYYSFWFSLDEATWNSITTCEQWSVTTTASNNNLFQTALPNEYGSLTDTATRSFPIATPEPVSMILFGLGSIGLALKKKFF